MKFHTKCFQELVVARKSFIKPLNEPETEPKQLFSQGL